MPHKKDGDIRKGTRRMVVGRRRIVEKTKMKEGVMIIKEVGNMKVMVKIIRVME
jgi:hypothetical protein